MHYPLIIGEAFERVGIDVIEPLNKTKRGNSYIVMAIDYLTKFIIIKSIPNKSAVEISNFIMMMLF